MVPESQWRDAGMNMDKRTARKVHREDFKKTIHDIRQTFLKKHVARDEDDHAMEETASNNNHHVDVYVRKRPILPHEHVKNEFDVISAIGRREIVIHECKMYPDMKHKYVVSHHQRFSRCYDERVETEQVYHDTTKPLVLHAMRGGKAVCMMYGQTGSGKTYTMGGLFQYIAEDLFTEPVGDVDFSIAVSAIEIVGSKCYDLLQNQRPVSVCEDRDGIISILNVSEEVAHSTNALYEVLQNVKNLRSTETTAVNSQSSRSHLVCYINLRHESRSTDTAPLYGQLVLLDLAGSERSEDQFHHDAARRKETIEINKSHLALKQCIRALATQESSNQYVPYRSSTLTRILKGCLWSADCRGAVIATISPLSVDTEHTLYTLLCAGEMLEDHPVISVEKLDVREGEECPFVPIKEWDNRMVMEWLCALRKGEFKKYASNFRGTIDGRMLTRLSMARFTQLCEGNQTDASHLFKLLRTEMASHEKLLKDKRARTIAKHHHTSKKAH